MTGVLFGDRPAFSPREMAAKTEQITALQKRCGELLEARRGIRYHVHEFHHAMGQPVLDSPRVPTLARTRLRLRLIAEEFFELARACGVECDQPEKAFALGLEYAELEVDLPELADACADLDYVVEGTRLEHGIDGWPIAVEVHRANMQKVDASQRDDGKILKPEGWVPPDIEGELRKQGWGG